MGRNCPYSHSIPIRNVNHPLVGHDVARDGNMANISDPKRNYESPDHSGFSRGIQHSDSDHGKK